MTQATPTHEAANPQNNHALTRWLQRCPVGLLLVLVGLLAVLLQLPLVFNPGYFSHDELQWAAWADVAGLSAMRWNDWLAFSDYQYRPLTFNLWRLLSYWCFDQPMVFHGVLVLWGSLNASLLWLAARRFGLSVWPAMTGTLLFVASPYAMYVHGWVATMADLLVMSFALSMLSQLCRTQRPLMALLLGAGFTAVALISKESALSLPAVLGVIWLLGGRQKVWFMATWGAGLVALAYLALRLPVLLSQPENTHYGLSLWQMPWRWLEYHLYWISPHLTEPHTTLAKGLRGSTVVAASLVLGLFVILWLAHRRLFWAALLGGLALLAPVLPLAASAAQYGYLFAAGLVLLVAAAWRHCQRWGRVWIMLLSLLSVWHGVNTALLLRDAGRIQAVFSPALAQAVAQHPADQALRLRLDEGAPRWLFIRLTSDVPSYRGVELGQRVQWAATDEAADYVVQADGQIRAVNQP
ncbi:hypothetical protein [Marinicella meishanensis]|uniref:hypothetical protein n=1 Tax=Marinicella meishanensis TaxID=2873263 RepID=UPI001CC11F96|nr:hypothetical protein [Marinicella sp. NBU2979]